ncbi:hypothetical protein AWB90_05325 [Mycobacterium paraense]|uniref:Uncharacterized protein n=1 Tax=Mycobacterium paraense TaxID=767916 RepID=A0A1X2AIY9_9MYCO|nr:hypothetical protein [Mycobacterium paraense]ORW51345.1 hypothetical protein AWB90_05325 [Mycobacterium paraense]
MAGQIELAIEWVATYLSTGPKTERQWREDVPHHLGRHAINCAKKRLGVVTFRRDWRTWLALPTDPSIPTKENR